MKRIEIALFMVILGLLLMTGFLALTSPDPTPAQTVAAASRPAPPYLK